ncbi:MAG: hypothetical protein KDI79_27025 [Anaerolineae bacterium]|nr:hypothetical protein [Anaerolineae bacterium]
MIPNSLWNSKKFLMLIIVCGVTAVSLWSGYTLRVRAQSNSEATPDQTVSATPDQAVVSTSTVSATLTAIPETPATAESSPTASDEATPPVTGTIELTATPALTITPTPTSTATPPPATVVNPTVTSTPIRDVTVTPALYGDANQDGVVDQGDLDFIAAHIGSNDPRADVNGDGKVDVLDLSIVADIIEQSNPGQPQSTPTPAPTGAATVSPTVASSPTPTAQSGTTPISTPIAPTSTSTPIAPTSTSTPVTPTPTPTQEEISYEDYGDYGGYDNYDDYDNNDAYEDYQNYLNGTPTPATFAPDVTATVGPIAEATTESPLFIEGYSDSITDGATTGDLESFEPYEIYVEAEDDASTSSQLPYSLDDMYVEQDSAEGSTLINDLSLINACGDAQVEQPVIDICYLVFVAVNYGNQGSPSDINLDGEVDLQDLIAIANSYNHPASDLWQLR